MEKIFVRCMGKTACQETEGFCKTCGRSLDEIYNTRSLIDNLVNFTQKMGYENTDAFFEYVAAKAARKSNYLRESDKTVTK